jgi:hypothetical protein
VQDLYVIAEFDDVVNVHAPQDAPADGGDLVIDKIHFAVTFEQAEDFFQQALFAVEGVGVGLAIRRQGLNANQFVRDAGGRKNVVGYACFDGAAGHSVVLGGFKILDKGDAAAVLDGGQADGSVGGGSGEDHADGVGRLILGQRTEECVDRHVVATAGWARDEMQHAIRDGHLRVWRENVDGIKLDSHPVCHLMNGKRGGPGQQFNHCALVGGIEMWDENEGDAGIGG